MYSPEEEAHILWCILCINSAHNSMEMCLGRVFEGKALEIVAIEMTFLRER